MRVSLPGGLDWRGHQRLGKGPQVGQFMGVWRRDEERRGGKWPRIRPEFCHPCLGELGWKSSLHHTSLGAFSFSFLDVPHRHEGS